MRYPARPNNASAGFREARSSSTTGVTGQTSCISYALRAIDGPSLHPSTQPRETQSAAGAAPEAQVRAVCSITEPDRSRAGCRPRPMVDCSGSSGKDENPRADRGNRAAGPGQNRRNCQPLSGGSLASAGSSRGGRARYRQGLRSASEQSCAQMPFQGVISKAVFPL